MSPRYVEAGRFWHWFLTRYSLVGIVMPIPFRPTCYYLPPWNKCPEFVRHENVHFRQIACMGAIRFTITYLTYLALYGYRDNPLEQEAYGQKAQADVQTYRQGQGLDAKAQG